MPPGSLVSAARLTPFRQPAVCLCRSGWGLPVNKDMSRENNRKSSYFVDSSVLLCVIGQKEKPYMSLMAHRKDIKKIFEKSYL